MSNKEKLIHQKIESIDETGLRIDRIFIFVLGLMVIASLGAYFANLIGGNYLKLLVYVFVLFFIIWLFVSFLLLLIKRTIERRLRDL